MLLHTSPESHGRPCSYSSDFPFSLKGLNTLATNLQLYSTGKLTLMSVSIFFSWWLAVVVAFRATLSTLNMNNVSWWLKNNGLAGWLWEMRSNLNEPCDGARAVCVAVLPLVVVVITIANELNEGAVHGDAGSIDPGNSPACLTQKNGCCAQTTRPLRCTDKLVRQSKTISKKKPLKPNNRTARENN